MNHQGWERTRLDLHPADTPPDTSPAPVVAEEVESRVRRVRAVRSVCTAINLVCWVFALVLAAHVLLVLGEANPNNGFASFVDSWAAGVSLGFHGLFTPDSVKLQTLFNDGAAALAWLLIAGVLTYAIRRFALPGPRTTVHPPPIGARRAR